MSEQNTSGALILDGATFDDVTRWVYQHYPEVTPLLLLRGTDYAAIAESGPVLIGTTTGSSIYRQWQSGVEPLADAVWLESRLPVQTLFASLQRRLRVRAPDGREFWLRLGIASALHRAWQGGQRWPDGFWFGIDRVWLPHTGSAQCAWSNPDPQADCTRPGANPMQAQVVLDWPLLQALSESTPHEEER